MLVTTLVFLALIGLLVFVHELGHFLIAKRNGVLVEEFAFGFKPRLLSKKVGETTYALNLIPLGGYVKLYGEQEGESGKRSFKEKRVGQRLAILAAGSVMNLLLGFIVLIILFITGFQPILPGVETNPFLAEKPQLAVGATFEGSPAAQADLRAGDVIKNIDGQTVDAVGLVGYVGTKKGSNVELVTERGGEIRTQTLAVRSSYPDGQGPLGVKLASVGEARSAWYASPLAAGYETGRVVGLSVQGFAVFVKNLLVHQQVSEDVTGLIGVGALTGVARRLGIEYLAQLLVAISIGLGVINLMPIMPLDGGHIVALGYEKAKGRPMSEKQMGYFVTFGLAFVILVFLLVTYKDVVRFDVLNRLF